MVDPEKWAGIFVDSREITGDATIETLRFQDENENRITSARFDFKFAGRILNKKNRHYGKLHSSFDSPEKLLLLSPDRKMTKSQTFDNLFPPTLHSP